MNKLRARTHSHALARDADTRRCDKRSFPIIVALTSLQFSLLPSGTAYLGSLSRRARSLGRVSTHHIVATLARRTRTPDCWGRSRCRCCCRRGHQRLHRPATRIFRLDNLALLLLLLLVPCKCIAIRIMVLRAFISQRKYNLIYRVREVSSSPPVAGLAAAGRGSVPKRRHRSPFPGPVLPYSVAV